MQKSFVRRGWGEGVPRYAWVRRWARRRWRARAGGGGSGGDRAERFCERGVVSLEELVEVGAHPAGVDVSVEEAALQPAWNEEEINYAVGKYIKKTYASLLAFRSHG